MVDERRLRSIGMGRGERKGEDLRMVREERGWWRGMMR